MKGRSVTVRLNEKDAAALGRIREWLTDMQSRATQSLTDPFTESEAIRAALRLADQQMKEGDR